MPKTKCNNCDERRVCQNATRTVGGSYNRAPHQRPCNVCEDCARRLLANQTQGHRTVNRWSVTSLTYALARFDRLATREETTA